MTVDTTLLCDALLYRSDLADRKSMTSFFNLISNAVTYGMVMSSARTGLGTDNPMGPSIPGESLYYQALHAYSAFDWEFQTRLLADGTIAALPREIAILAGRFREDFADTFTDEHLEEVALAQRVACTLAPSLKPFVFRRLEDADHRVEPSAKYADVSPAIREELWTGSRAKLDAIELIACTATTGDLETKLATMASAFAPICTVFSASFDPDDPTSSFTRLSVYVPALHTLHADDVDDPRGWFLERGVPTTGLPEPVQVSAASLTHFSYLREADRTHHQGVQFEVRRDFCAPHSITLVVGFGRFFARDSKDLLGFDTGDHRDALHVLLKAKLPVESQDSAAIRTAKENFNKAMSGFDIEARIHQLTLHLVRDDDTKGRDEEQLLRPQFSLEESRISFRIQRFAESKTERLSLKAAGFEVTETDEGVLCWREFWTWDRLREFFGGEAASGRGLASMLVTGRERLLGQAVGRATKLVLDHSIESIERSLDEEIARIVSDYLERYATARDALSGRLHEGLF